MPKRRTSSAAARRRRRRADARRRRDRPACSARAARRRSGERGGQGRSTDRAASGRGSRGESFNTVLLASSALLLVAVVSVRLADRTGLPSLLIYLGVGLAFGEAGLGIRFEDYEITAELGPARARADPRRGRAHDAVGGRAAGAAVRGRPGDRGRGRQRRGRRRPEPPGARRRRPQRGDPRQHRGLDRRGRGLLGAAQAAPAAAAALGARGRVGAQRRTRRRPGRAGVVRRLGVDVAAGGRRASSATS